MKVSFPARRFRGGILPHGDDAQEMFATIKDGAEFICEVRTVRSLKQLKLFWGLMGLLAENCETFTSKDDAADNIKLDCGEVDWFVHHRTGVKFGRPRSIAFESMSQDRFNRFMNRVLFVIESEYLPGASMALMRRVYEMLKEPMPTWLLEKEAA